MEFTWLTFCVVASIVGLGGASLFVYHARASGGFGPYNSSTLLLILALTITGVISAVGILDKSTLGNVLMGVIGFAGGIVAGKQDK
ncbi:TPA: hypothetical protein RUW98_000449 [Aeromonas veronii]|nr:hypothetical protein [Aeromonas veronii]